MSLSCGGIDSHVLTARHLEIAEFALTHKLLALDSLPNVTDRNATG
ncbi:MAG: hypothetical protein KME13_04490 [Myxacorys californica WJT36-NPBG1]|nr:hypothetical protein [Myxacorys californica WJT36-NPBG1]